MRKLSQSIYKKKRSASQYKSDETTEAVIKSVHYFWQENHRYMNDIKRFLTMVKQW